MGFNPFEMAFSPPAESPEEVMDHIGELEDAPVEDPPTEETETVEVAVNTITEESTIDHPVEEPVKRRGRPPGSKNKSRVIEGEGHVEEVKALIEIEEHEVVATTTVMHPKSMGEFAAEDKGWDGSSLISAISTMPNMVYMHADQSMLAHITNKFIGMCQSTFLGKTYNSDEGAAEHMLVSDTRMVLGSLLAVWKAYHSEKFWEALSKSAAETAGLKDKEAKAKCSGIERTISMLEYWYDNLLVRLDSMAHIDRTY